MNNYDRKFLSRLLRAERDCLMLANQEKDEQFRHVAALLQEARIEIITLNESLDDARSVIQRAVDAAQALAPFVLAYIPTHRPQEQKG